MAANDKKSFIETFKGLLFMSDTRNTRPVAGAMLVAHEATSTTSSSETNQQNKQNVNNQKLSVMKRMFGI